jgi:hypothetical protein
MAKGTKSALQHLAQGQDQRKTAKALEPCAQLEFQSAVDLYRFLAAMKRSLGRKACRRNMTF